MVETWKHGDPPRPSMAEIHDDPDWKHRTDPDITSVDDVAALNLVVGEVIFVITGKPPVKTLMRVTISDGKSFTAELAGPDEAKAISPDDPPREIRV